MIGLLLSAALSLSSPAFDEQAPLPVVSIDAKPYGIDIVSIDGDAYEVLALILDPWEFALTPDPVTATECANLATVTCGSAGVSWLRYRYNATTGDYTCEFGCNTTGTGG